MAASVRRAAEEQVGPGCMGLGVPSVRSAPTRSSSGFATSVCPLAPRVGFLHPVLPAQCSVHAVWDVAALAMCTPRAAHLPRERRRA